MLKDYTRRMKVNDIKGMVLMTPLIFDDTLMLVRIFRFYSKLGFRIDNRIYMALWGW